MTTTHDGLQHPSAAATYGSNHLVVQAHEWVVCCFLIKRRRNGWNVVSLRLFGFLQLEKAAPSARVTTATVTPQAYMKLTPTSAWHAVLAGSIHDPNLAFSSVYSCPQNTYVLPGNAGSTSIVSFAICISSTRASTAGDYMTASAQSAPSEPAPHFLQRTFHSRQRTAHRL